MILTRCVSIVRSRIVCPIGDNLSSTRSIKHLQRGIQGRGCRCVHIDENAVSHVQVKLVQINIRRTGRKWIGTQYPVHGVGIRIGSHSLPGFGGTRNRIVSIRIDAFRKERSPSIVTDDRVIDRSHERSSLVFTQSNNLERISCSSTIFNKLWAFDNDRILTTAKVGIWIDWRQNKPTLWLHPTAYHLSRPIGNQGTCMDRVTNRLDHFIGRISRWSIRRPEIKLARIFPIVNRDIVSTPTIAPNHATTKNRSACTGSRQILELESHTLPTIVQNQQVPICMEGPGVIRELRVILVLGKIVVLTRKCGDSPDRGLPRHMNPTQARRIQDVVHDDQAWCNTGSFSNRPRPNSKGNCVQYR